MTKMRLAILWTLGLILISMSLQSGQAQETPTEEPEATAVVTDEVATEEAEATEVSTPEATSEVIEGQEDCPRLVQEALDITQTRCDILSNNEVCYGHSTLDAASRPGYPDFKFDEPGDIEQVIEMQSLSLSPMDVDQDQWGVILMQVRASLEQSAQQNTQATAEPTSTGGDDPVTFVVFGDTELTAPNVVLEGNVLSTQAVNLRAQPSASSSIVTALEAAEDVILNGRTEDGSWLRVRYITDAGDVSLGWIAAELVELQTDAEIDTLDVIDVDEVTDELPFNYGPMQAFYFRSGSSDAPCEAAPNSGMLIQTPEGLATVTLWIDEVIVELSGTTYVQTDENGNLTLNALDGSIDVTASGSTTTAVTGTEVTVPLNDDLTVAGVPNDPQPIDLNNLQGLPVELLDEPVDIPNPLDIPAGAPAPGLWSFQWGVGEQACPSGNTFTFQASGVPQQLTVSDTSISYGSSSYVQISEGVYQQTYADDEGNLHQDTLTVSSLNSIQGTSVIDIISETTPCTLTVPFSLSFIS